MILEEEGRLDLDRPVSYYLPRFDAPDKSGITVRHLLTHSAGFISGAALWRDRRGSIQFIERMNEQPLVYVPGDSSIYSDWGFMLTGFIVESISGQRLDDFLEERVWKPLGMRDTYFNPLLLVGLPDEITCTSAFRPREPTPSFRSPRAQSRRCSRATDPKPWRGSASPAASSP